MDKIRNKKRMSRGLLVGIIAVFMLSVSVFAAYGSTSGYGKFKDAVNDLLQNQKNLSFSARYDLNYDGEKIFSESLDFKLDGKNHSSHSYSDTDDTESFDSVINGIGISFAGDSEDYYEYKIEEASDGLLDLGGYNQQVLKFANLLADSLAGDLKNNVVLVDEKDGVSFYELSVTGEQLPAVITAGLDLMIASSQECGGYVSYEEYNEAFKAYYQKVTGKALPADFFDTIYADDISEIKNYDKLWEEYDKYSCEMDEYYQGIVDKQGNESAILYVKNDGTYELYKNYAEMTQVIKDTGNPFAYLDTNAVFDNGTFRYSVDQDNHLLDCLGSLTYGFVDAQGQQHQLEVGVKAKFFDYGTTEVTPFDTGNRTRCSDEE